MTIALFTNCDPLKDGEALADILPDCALFDINGPLVESVITQAQFADRVVLWPSAGPLGSRQIVLASQLATKLKERGCEDVRIVLPKWPSGKTLLSATNEPPATIQAMFDDAGQFEPAPSKPVAKRETPAATQAPELHSAVALWERLDLARDNRAPYPTEANALRIITAHKEYAGRIWLNEFSQRLMIDDGDGSRQFSRTDAIQALVWMQQALQLPKMPLSAIERASMLVGEQNKRHPVKRYLEGLKWDGKERLPTWMAAVFGCEQNDYTAAVGRCWLVAMVARILKPGCKHDCVPVFEGPQGIRKSTALGILGGEWFLESTENPVGNRKDFLLSIQGKWLIEIPEIDRVGGSRGSLNDLTGMITILTDTYRVPYGTTTMDYPRQCVFSGTTNAHQWQPDQTGGRRFWPITCGKINTELLAQLRDQLFAEAVVRFKRNEKWHDVPNSEAEAEQEARRLGDEWETLIERFEREVPRREYGQVMWCPRPIPAAFLTVGDILLDCLGIAEARWTRSDQMRVVSCLTALGYERIRIGTGRDRKYAYRKKLTV